jgi:para-nitrobenzyl esterase
MLRATSRASAKTAADVLLASLGLTGRDVRKLQQVPFTQLLAAQADREAAARARGEAPGSFSPVLDGVAMPRHPFDPDAPAVSANVPMMISTVLDDRSYRMANFDQTWNGVRTAIRPPAGMSADDLIALYRREDSRASPYLIQARIVSDQGRGAAVTMAERKAAQGGAPAYMYLWKSPSPAYGGRYGATHGVDVGPSMREVRGGPTGANANSIRLADELASAMAAFAATGDPNNARLPRWEPYEARRRMTMVFDDPRTHAVADPRGELRTLWQNAARAQAPGGG